MGHSLLNPKKKINLGFSYNFLLSELWVKICDILELNSIGCFPILTAFLQHSLQTGSNDPGRPPKAWFQTGKTISSQEAG